MADGDEGAAIGVQRIFHRLDRFDVEMVDRFIQKQKLGRVLAADGAGERGARSLSPPESMAGVSRAASLRKWKRASAA